MIYELHLTVDHTQPNFSLGRWCNWCKDRGIKPLDIRVPGAAADRQVMFAAVLNKSYTEAAAWSYRLFGSAMRNGFEVVRQKLEVPLDKSAPFNDPAYHECHIKSLLPGDKAPDIVSQLIDMGWLASWNDLFTHDAGLEKWYFTRRAYNVDYLQAGREFAETYAQLAEVNWHTVRMESETVISDNNPDLDKGWAFD